MAIITDNKNGTLSVQLTIDEQRTFAALPTDQLQAYVTLWMADQSPRVLSFQFGQLSTQDKSDMQSKLDVAGQGKKIG